MKKVLIVDPNMINFKLYKMIISDLNEFECEVEHANGPDMALTLLSKRHFDLIVSELFPIARETYSNWLNQLNGKSDKAIIVIASANLHAYNDIRLQDKFPYYFLPLDPLRLKDDLISYLKR